jgi:hypothetical protein
MKKVKRKFASGFNNPLFFNKVDKLKVQVLCMLKRNTDPAKKEGASLVASAL